MAESIETSDIANKSFCSNVIVLLFVVKLHIKKFKQFCLFGIYKVMKLLFSLARIAMASQTLFCKFYKANITLGVF